MAVAIVTGSSGLIGSEAVKYLHEKGLDVIGIDNHMRSYFFGDDGSVEWNTQRLTASLPRFRHVSADIRDAGAIDAVFAQYAADIVLVI
ncbi:MAG: NAD-dependent epimerase/dehydratase family protein, partial [bacterium]|nr:NAD-dependent epimerase/dehydratase family protein [Candidatus Kapabacteria bacterium]